MYLNDDHTYKIPGMKRHQSLSYEGIAKWYRQDTNIYADSTCVSWYAKVHSYIDNYKYIVKPLYDSYTRIKEFRMYNIILVYNNNDNDKTNILRINNCLDFTSDMKYSLILTHQYRSINYMIKIIDYIYTNKHNTHIINGITISIHICEIP